MKTMVVGVAASFLLASACLYGADAPRGEFLELHSCQVYIGGCIASSEATQEGQYLLRVWSFAGGSYKGNDFGGLQVALLEVADQNLAVSGSQPTESMIYLPQAATPGHLYSTRARLRCGRPCTA